MRVSVPLAAFWLAACSTAAGRSATTVVPAPREAPLVSELRYEVSFNRRTAQQRSIEVRTTFATGGDRDVLLSLPAWTPGAYELSGFARNVLAFDARGDSGGLAWDKADADTWRIRPAGSRRVTVTFVYRADSLDNAMSWTRPDFAFFNGTNVFLYPEGDDPGFAARVDVVTEPGWKVATGMARVDGSSWGEANYHDLVDMPFFVGAMDLDSAMVAGRWMRLATWPAGHLAGEARAELWKQLTRVVPPMREVFGEIPWESYTNLVVFDSSSAGASALEHGNSHLGIYSPLVVGSVLLPSITAHEIFHAWNVKRLRPADLVPYRYDRPQPTPWLWVSEGITDYYADVVLLRGGIIDAPQFLEMTNAKIEEVEAAPPVALEDASLSTWVHPVDGTGYLYYPKGSLAGLLLDVMIRDASDNAASLDDAMRDLYDSTFRRGRGFNADDWWGAVSRAARGKSFSEFHSRFIDGREAFPWAEVLPLAGLRFRVDSIREPRIGVFTRFDSAGVVVTETDSGSAAREAGIVAGDLLLSVGDVAVEEGFGERFRARYGRSPGITIPVRVRRNGVEVTLPMVVRLLVRTERHLVPDPAASLKAGRIRSSLLRGGA